MENGKLAIQLANSPDSTEFPDYFISNGEANWPPFPIEEINIFFRELFLWTKWYTNFPVPFPYQNFKWLLIAGRIKI